MAQRAGSYIPSTKFPRLEKAADNAGRPFEHIGRQVTFVLDTIAGLPHTVRAYRNQTLAAFAETTWGNGSILVGGGIASVLAILGVSVGGMIGILGTPELVRKAGYLALTSDDLSRPERFRRADAVFDAALDRLDATTGTDSVLGPAGSRVRGHEFHRTRTDPAAPRHP